MTTLTQSRLKRARRRLCNLLGLKCPNGGMDGGGQGWQEDSDDSVFLSPSQSQDVALNGELGAVRRARQQVRKNPKEATEWT